MFVHFHVFTNDWSNGRVLCSVIKIVYNINPTLLSRTCPTSILNSFITTQQSTGQSADDTIYFIYAVEGDGNYQTPRVFTLPNTNFKPIYLHKYGSVLFEIDFCFVFASGDMNFDFH